MKNIDKISIFLIIGASILATIGWPTVLGISLTDAGKQALPFLNTTFVITAFSTLVAAYAGAYGAHAIARKDRIRDALLQEVRSINVAITVAFGICNAFLSLKEQHVKKLKEDFDNDRAAIVAILQAPRPPGAPYIEITFRANFLFLQPLSVPTDVLSAQVFEKISVGSRTLSLVTMLQQTIHALNDGIQQRNELITKYQENRPQNQGDYDLVWPYFGLRDPNGHEDNSYPSILEAIYRYTDDCIYYSHRLCEDLHEYGELLKNKLGEGAPRIIKPDFSIVEDGLMPNTQDYIDWEKAFIKPPT